MSDFTHLMHKATDIADKAAEIAASHFRKALLIEMKPDDTPVTIADRKAEEYVREAIRKEFPSHGMWGEEFGKENEGSEFIWTIDPIDGTRSFVRGIPLWGTLLGLLYQGAPIAGVIVLPILKETYAAARGVGAFCNGQRVSVSNTKALKHAIVAHADREAFEMTGKQDFLSLIQKKSGLVRSYTDCFAHAMLIRGSIDVMIDPIVAPWDIIPVACILEEAGGTYFTFDGKPIANSSSFVGCTPKLQKTLQLLNQ